MNANCSSNGSPKAAGSPKFARRPKKPQAPKIPPLPKDRFGSSAMECVSDVPRPTVSPVKPSVPAKPRHERHSSNASVDLTTLSEEESTNVVVNETKDEARSSLDAMVLPGLPPRHHRRNDSGSSGEWPKVTPRAIQPKLAARDPPKVENAEKAEVDIPIRKTSGTCASSPDAKLPLASPTETVNDNALKNPPSPGKSHF